MRISVIKIGNSKGIRLGKAILEKYGFKDQVELELNEDYLIVRPVKSVREGWDEAFAKMAQEGDDQLLIDDVFEDEDFEL